MTLLTIRFETRKNDKVVFFLMLSLISCSTFSMPNLPVPLASKTAFSKKFPTATNVRWGRENTYEYEANFKINGVSYSANFNDRGEWLETESRITFKELPTSVLDTYNIRHKGVPMKTAAKIESANGETKYEIEFKKGIKTKEEFYDSKGVVLQ